MTKRYRLIRDYDQMSNFVPSGTIGIPQWYRASGQWNHYFKTPNPKHGNEYVGLEGTFVQFSNSECENNPEWFEEIKYNPIIEGLAKKIASWYWGKEVPSEIRKLEESLVRCLAEIEGTVTYDGKAYTVTTENQNSWSDNDMIELIEWINKNRVLFMTNQPPEVLMLFKVYKTKKSCR